MPDGPAQITVKDWAEVRETMAALRERTHQQGNAQMGGQALVEAVRRIEAAAAAPAPRTQDIPAWTKWVAVCGTILTIGALVVGLIWSASATSSTVAANLATLNSWKIEQTTANLPARMQNLETGIDTARRIRDQQQQSANDRMRALELADQAGAERLNNVLQQLATIIAQLQAQAARVEELMRRQDRLESRLGARPGSAMPQDQPTSYTPLVWRPLY